MDDLSHAYIAASERLAAKRGLIATTYDHVRERTVRYLDVERVPRRVARLLDNPLIEQAFRERGVADELRKTAALDALSAAAHDELERVIGGTDFMPAWFLARGAELRRTVARVRARTASGKDVKGTAFLVGPRLALTNHHVLDWSDIGQEPLDQIVPHTLLEFDYEEQFNGTMQPLATYKLQPSTLLLASPWDELDYVLVAVEPLSSEARVPIDSFGHNRLAGDLGKINKGEPVFIVQHPSGQPKQVVLQNNRLIDRDDTLPYLTYEADTEPGSSGAPVFNRQWEVVALHHSPQIARDAAGRILAKSGGVWTEDMGSAMVKFLDLNEGVRVSRILADLAAKYQLMGAGESNRLAAPERISADGLKLLEAALKTHAGARPTDLIAPVPAARVGRPGSAAPARRPGEFANPE